jgi:hypothetical protein
MKETSEKPSAVVDIPDNVNAEKPTPFDDGDLNKQSNEEEKKEEGGGGLKDYFVSQRLGRF